MSKNQIMSDKAPEPVGLYPHAKRAGNFVYFSGIGPRAKNSKDIPGVTLDEEKNILAYDIAKQCHSVFQNLQAVVKASDVEWTDLIDITVFLTNMKANFKTYNTIYAEYFADAMPCRTTIEISSLPTPIAIEVKAIAYKG